MDSAQLPSKEPWIQTYTGRKFHPLNPNIDSIVIEDIAHALSNICRFTGHIKSFYSVGQHSVLVSYLCDKADALHGLLHDSSEAYCTDLNRPVKHSPLLEGYRQIEKKLQSMIYERFGLSAEEPISVKQADNLMLATEARDLLGSLHPDWELTVDPLPFKIDPLPPKEAKDLFMKRFYELGGYDSHHYENYLKNQ